MKKTYIEPTLIVKNCLAQATILAGSGLNTGDAVGDFTPENDDTENQFSKDNYMSTGSNVWED